MKEQEIPRERWPGFLAGFSREHRGWLATVGVIRTERLLARHREAARALVRDVVFRDLRLVGEAVNALVVETEPVTHDRPASYHSAERPLRVFFEEGDDGAHKGLRVDSADGQSLLVEFRAGARPETLDGLTGSEEEPL